MSPAKRILIAVVGLIAIGCLVGVVISNVNSSTKTQAESIFDNTADSNLQALWNCTPTPICSTPTPAVTCRPPKKSTPTPTRCPTPTPTRCPTPTPTPIPTPCPTEKAPELRPQISDAPVGGGEVEPENDIDGFQLTPLPRS